LGSCPGVDAATSEYIKGEDDVQSWINERCKTESNAEARASVLYGDWQQYATTNRLGSIPKLL